MIRGCANNQAHHAKTSTCKYRAAGVAKSAKNIKEAIELLEFLASPLGSSSMAGPTHEYPLKGFGSSKQLNAFGPFTPDNVSINALGRTQKKALQIMAQEGWR